MELWAKKRPINNIGQPYEFITYFDNENQKYFLSDQLDREIYQECMVTNGNNQCIMYREFERPYVKRMVKK